MKRKNETFNEAVVGVFMTVVVLLLAYFTIVISGVDVFGTRSLVKLTILFDQVGGLKNHDNVMYRGTKVGSVDSVVVTPSNLVVCASVDRNVVLRDGYEITVCNLSMLGGNYLLLDEGQGEALNLDGLILRGKTPVDWMRDVSRIAENVRSITEMREIASIVTNIDEVSFQTKAFMVKANAFADELQGVVGEARSFITNATSAAKRIDLAAEKADHLVANLDRQPMFDDLEAGIAAFREAADGLDVKTTVAKANALLDKLNNVAQDLHHGEGTFAKLLNDPAMYDEAQRFMKDMNGLLKDMRQVLDNYRDTTPITTFSSLATGAL